MITLRTLTIVAALVAGGTSRAMAQNGLPTGGERPVAGGANGGGWGGGWYGGSWYAGVRSTAMATDTDTRPTGLCTATTGLTGATGIGITKEIAKTISAHQSVTGSSLVSKIIFKKPTQGAFALACQGID